MSVVRVVTNKNFKQKLADFYGSCSPISPNWLQASTPVPGVNGVPAKGLPMAILSLKLLFWFDMISALGILGICLCGGLSGSSIYAYSLSSCSMKTG